MRTRMLVWMALAGTLAACTDGTQPVAARSATDGVARRTLPPISTNVGIYSRGGDTLTIYDQRPELGVSATRDRFSSVAAGGMRLVRYAVYRSDANASTDLDNALADAAANGVELEVVVENGLCREYWADPYTPYAQYVANMVSTHPGVRFWELLNEPEVAYKTDMLGGQGPTECGLGYGATHYGVGYNYAQLMKMAYPMIKAANPNAWVLMAGLASPDTAFLDGFYDGGGRQYYDFLNVHAYGSNANGADPFNRGEVLQNTASLKGDPGRPVWLTEFGHGGQNDLGGPYTATQYDDSQKSFWTTFMSRNSAYHTYAKMIGYHLLTTDNSYWPSSVIDLPSGRTTADYGAGILRMNGDPRPTYTYVAGSGYNNPVFTTPNRTVTIEVTSADMVPADYPYGIVRDDRLRIYNIPLNYRAPTNIRFVPGNTTAPPVCDRTGCYYP
jgi:hypothetical protein